MKMTFPYKINFEEMVWETPIEGVRHKCLDQDGQRIRLVEYSDEMPAHWCEKGHCGYMIEGEMEIEYPGARITYGPGDGIFIPDGPEHRHRGKVLSGKALVFFIESIGKDE